MKPLNPSKTKLFLLAGALLSSSCFADTQKEPADMSDPMAVYNQFGAGLSDRGLNLKFGQAYDTGSDTTMGMNVVELKGLWGDALGWSGSSKRDGDIDSLRFRNFQVDMTNGRGNQIDVTYNVERESFDASYSLMQALPKMGSVSLYPLAGLGVNIQNNAIDGYENGQPVIDSGYSVPGIYGLVGMYGKWQISDKIWANYNPMFLSSIAGSDHYTDNTYGAGKSNIFLHEVIMSYQINPLMNVRYFANFNDDVSFNEGEHRIEFNYQF